MQRAVYIYAAVLTLLVTAFVLYAFKDKSNDSDRPYTSERILADGQLPQVIRAVSLDENLNFAGVTFDVSDDDIKERLDRELLVNAYWQSNTLLNIKRSARYFPVIEPILAKHGVPDDFKYLAVAESGLTNAVSPAGAKGYWQFLAGTARDYGLEVTNDVDERYHIEKATDAAARYLKRSYDRFGDWLLVAAAYNMGEGNVNKYTREQSAEDYFDLNLNEETARYAFRLVAIKTILANPEQFGFYLEEDDYYAPMDHYSVVRVTESVPNWGEFAKKYGISYRELKRWNPWLRDSNLNNSRGTEYEVRIPRKQ